MEFVSQSAGFWVFVWVVRFSFSFETGLQARSFQSEGFGRDEEDSKIKQVSDRSVSSVRSCLRVFFFFFVVSGSRWGRQLVRFLQEQI
jgi:hypothetical protein